MRTSEQEIALARRSERQAALARVRRAQRVADLAAILRELFAEADPIPLQVVLQAFRNRGLEELALAHKTVRARRRTAKQAHEYRAERVVSGPSSILVEARRSLGVQSYRLPPEPRGPLAAYSTPRALQVWSRQTYAANARAHRERLELT